MVQNPDKPMSNTNNINTSQSQQAKKKWNQIYQKPSPTVVAPVLADNKFLLPQQGKALDLACGLGANALFLAQKGLETHAWDISSVALNKLQHTASQQSLNISTKQLFITPDLFPKNTFDVIIITRFLDRSLTNAIMDGLKLNGLLLYQTFVREKITTKGPNNPEFLLARNELLQLFHPLTVVSYKEYSLLGDLDCGERNEALFIGQKIK